MIVVRRHWLTDAWHPFAASKKSASQISFYPIATGSLGGI